MEYTIFYVVSPWTSKGKVEKPAVAAYGTMEEQKKAFEGVDHIGRIERGTNCSQIKFEFVEGGIQVWDPERKEATIYGTNRESRAVPNGTVLTKEKDGPYFDALVRFSQR